MNITRRRWFNAVVTFFLLAIAAYNLDIVNWFRSYSVDELVMNKLQQDHQTSALMYSDQSSKFQDDPGEIRKLLNSFENVKLRKVKRVDRSKADMGNFYLSQTINYRTQSYVLWLYGDGKRVEYLEVDDRQKKRSAHYRVIDGTINYAAIREVVDNGLSVDDLTAK